MDRRSWVKLGGVVCTTAAAVPFLFQRRASGEAPGQTLVRDPERLFDLRSGLNYRVLERVFDPMSDGYKVPGRPDGMACFNGAPGTWVLMRNHELDYNLSLSAYRGSPAAEAYDAEAAGSVTRLVLDAKTGQRMSSNLVLAGTLRNCGGGPSPWGFISCEETSITGHGYAFLCPIDQDTVRPPTILTGYGRYRHEAVCVHPNTHIAYLTEDQPDGCLYRFVPRERSQPFSGKLQALKHSVQNNYSLKASLKPGEAFEVDWVDIDNPDSFEDDVRYQAARAGAAQLSRGEGIWLSENTVWVCSTDGGRADLGQLFALELGPPGRRDRMRLVAESPGPETLDMPDNITVAPWGDIIVAEDGWGEQYLRGITPEGLVYDLGRNARSQGELAGVCFSPDGSTLFVNLQLDGLTLAISGTFPRA